MRAGQDLTTLTLGFRITCALFFVVGAVLLWGCGAGPQPTTTPTLEPPATRTPEPTATHTPEPTSTHTPEPTATRTPEPTATHTPEPTATHTPEPTATSTPEPTATHTPTPAQLSPAEVFEKVSPSIVFIETAAGTGSGVFLNGGHIVTNAHVVWPFNSVRVVFPDGSEFLDVPVTGLDTIADIAVLGPIDSSAAGLELVDGEGLSVGANTFLIGYPAESDDFPTPTIVRSLLSRFRELESIGITLMQTDAVPVGGQSGGALVSAKGEVIGITIGSTAEGGFGLATSSGDILPRLREILADGAPSHLGDRRIPKGRGKLSQDIAFKEPWAQRAYVVDELPGTVVEVEFEGDASGRITVLDPFGREILLLVSKKEAASVDEFVIESVGPHFLVARRLAEHSGEFTLTGSHRLISFHDPDDGRQLNRGDSRFGNIDFPADVDQYYIDLREGEIIRVEASSFMVDPVLTVYYLGAEFEQIIIDDNSGGGLFAHDAKLVYRAPHAGRYYVAVSAPNIGVAGGYVVTASRAASDEPLTQTTRASWSEDAADEPAPSTQSQFGLVELRSAFAGLPDSLQEYDPADLGFSIQNISVRPHASNLVVYNSEEPFHTVVAASGELSDLDRRSLDSDFSSGTLLEEITQGFIGGADHAQLDLELLDNGVLDSSTVGTSSFGVYLEVNFEGVEGIIEVIMFRRGDLFGFVYSYRHRGNPPIVSIDELGKMLDARMIEVILER